MYGCSFKVTLDCKKKRVHYIVLLVICSAQPPWIPRAEAASGKKGDDNLAQVSHEERSLAKFLYNQGSGQRRLHDNMHMFMIFNGDGKSDQESKQQSDESKIIQILSQIECETFACTGIKNDFGFGKFILLGGPEKKMYFFAYFPLNIVDFLTGIHKY